jgi:1-aminocyclopropane-1-carboxylate deaminase/D-cysteine desulfhydrase-like pyridoxal-dependent ACC family enzyme
MTLDMRAALEALDGLSSITLWPWPSPVHELRRLREHLGGGPRLLIKRDDLIGFGFGGNKVRKMALVAARALEEGADTLVTTGGLQSNHARTTAVVAAYLGLACHLVLNGERPQEPTGNLRLAQMVGAEVHCVPTRADRAYAMGALVQRLTADNRRPFVIPLGASTPRGALGFARAVGELLDQTGAPDVIVHSSSSGGTQAGLIAGCTLYRIPTRIIGVSADDRASTITTHVQALLQEMDGVLGIAGDSIAPPGAIEVDDTFVGPGYGLTSEASREAMRLLASLEGIFLDPIYTAKAMAALLAYVGAGRWDERQTVLFWHTGGVPALFM